MSLFCLTERVIKFLSLTLGIKSIMENTNEHQVNIELDETTALGVYSNLAIITHSPAEMVCDFVQLMPGMPKGKVRSRVIMTPHFGVIEDNETPPMPPMNFGNPSTLA